MNRIYNEELIVDIGSGRISKIWNLNAFINSIQY